MKESKKHISRRIESKLRRKIRNLVESVLMEENTLSVGTVIMVDGGYGKIVKPSHIGIVSWVKTNKYGDQMSGSIYSYMENHFNDLVKSGQIKIVSQA